MAQQPHSASSSAAAGGKRQLLKMVLLGDSGAGKTNLLNCYVHKKFDSRFKSTIGADFLSKEVTVDGFPTQLSLWDTAGQERFQSLGTAYLRGSDACVLVFDVTNQDSFEHLSSWMEEFVGQCGKKPIVVMANKCDADLEPGKRAITAATAKRWCQMNNDVQMFETSAKDAINVDNAFEYISQQALRERKAQADEIALPDPKRVKNVGAAPPQQQKKDCPC